MNLLIALIISVPGIAIFCMLLTYYLWIKAVKTGTLLWSALAAIAYFYMVGNTCRKSIFLLTKACS